MPPPVGVPARADQLRGLELVEVTDPAQRGIWNELMRSEHPRGAVQHAGAQLRYLLVSDHGVLGALGFAAAALTLAARDTFIGWDADQRSRQLHRVIGLSRFLIRSSVHCRNLASKALGLALRRLPDDFQHRYGYRPLLVETFVEKGRYQGTSLAAANWRRVGETAGRGRFAAPGAEVAVKAVWLYPLGHAWRAQLGVAEPPAPKVLGAAENLAADVWAEHEFGGARLGDVRLGKRLVQIVQRQGEAPTKSFPGAAQNDQAAVRGYYRLIDHPADSEVTPENILAPHRQRTLQRMQGQSAVLCIQDGTDLNFAEHPGCVGLGYIGKNKGSAGDAGAAHACDAGGERGGRAAGGAADPVRGAGREGGEGQAAGAAQDVPLDPGAAGVRGAGRSAAGVGDGPGGGRVRAVRGAAPAEESGPAGAGEAQPFAGRGRAEAVRLGAGRAGAGSAAAARGAAVGEAGEPGAEGQRGAGRAGSGRWNCAGGRWSWRTRTGRRRP